jgi:hypothetical protein
MDQQTQVDAPPSVAVAGANVVIVAPVLNDWASARVLLERIDALPLPGIATVNVRLVDDGSTEPVPDDLCATLGAGCIDGVAVLTLVCNVGHQRAIALGIASIVQDHAAGGAQVVVMDSDGEDDPSDIPHLLAMQRLRPDAIVVAGRSKRSEGIKFRLGYAAYQALFRILVGKRIDFGNFSTFGPAVARRLAGMGDTWNHLAAALLRSRVAIVTVPTERGRRYAGRSTMNLPALVAHGLSAFAAFSDHVFSRLLLFASLIGCFALLGGLSVILVRVCTNFAIPGWASVALGLFTTLFVQAILICLVAAVQMLAMRNQAGAQPRDLLGRFADKPRRLRLGLETSPRAL